MRTRMTGALAVSLVVCVVGCGTRTKPARPVPPESPDLVKITVVVKDMTKVLNIT